jgi:hypothetical protein
VESSLTRSESVYIDTGRKLDNKVQKAQRISAAGIISKQRGPKPFKVDLDMLPYTDEREHLMTVVGQTAVR